jgi:hypothetical protein
MLGGPSLLQAKVPYFMKRENTHNFLACICNATKEVQWSFTTHMNAYVYFHLTLLWTSEQVAVAVTSQPCVWEVFGSMFVRKPASVTKVFMVFLSPSRQAPREYHDYVTAISFKIISNALLLSHHPALWSSVVKQTREELTSSRK